MLIQTLIKLFNRELQKLIVELESYSNENNLWITTEKISNSAGNLSLHIIGNLNHFIGAEFGKTGFVRKRELEFSLKNVPREDIIKNIKGTIIIIDKVLNTLTLEDLQKEYSRRVFEDTMTTEYFMLHLLSHLTYHLGQINYHRRLLDKDYETRI